MEKRPKRLFLFFVEKINAVLKNWNLHQESQILNPPTADFLYKKIL